MSGRPRKGDWRPRPFLSFSSHNEWLDLPRCQLCDGYPRLPAGKVINPRDCRKSHYKNVHRKWFSNHKKQNVFVPAFVFEQKYFEKELEPKWRLFYEKRRKQLPGGAQFFGNFTSAQHLARVRDLLVLDFLSLTDAQYALLLPVSSKKAGSQSVTGGASPATGTAREEEPAPIKRPGSKQLPKPLFLRADSATTFRQNLSLVIDKEYIPKPLDTRRTLDRFIKEKLYEIFPRCSTAGSPGADAEERDVSHEDEDEEGMEAEDEEGMEAGANTEGPDVGRENEDEDEDEEGSEAGADTEGRGVGREDKGEDEDEDEGVEAEDEDEGVEAEDEDGADKGDDVQSVEGDGSLLRERDGDRDSGREHDLREGMLAMDAVGSSPPTKTRRKRRLREADLLQADSAAYARKGFGRDFLGDV